MLYYPFNRLSGLESLQPQGTVGLIAGDAAYKNSGRTGNPVRPLFDIQTGKKRPAHFKGSKIRFV